jgi:hypothetical protein
MSAVITHDIFQTLARTWCESPEPDAPSDCPTDRLDQLDQLAEAGGDRWNIPVRYGGVGVDSIEMLEIYPSGSEPTRSFCKRLRRGWRRQKVRASSPGIRPNVQCGRACSFWSGPAFSWCLRAICVNCPAERANESVVRAKCILAKCIRDTHTGTRLLLRSCPVSFPD